ncbi:hypothetical protein ABTY20_18985 [Streptomyces sp. NPDC126497]|uniref:hypothetical protein n=1 Tax=Streptomyces sp. NPDC126497 TaxID=3155313 RepID=UPI003322B19F
MTTQVDPFTAEAAKAVAFLSGQGGDKVPAAKFPKVGFEIDGTILSWRMTQQSDNVSKELLFWENKRPTPMSKVRFPDSARPVEMMVIEYQGDPTGVTWEGKDYEEVEVPDDSGRRVLYVTGGKINALYQALQAVGLQLPEQQGGRIQMRRERSVKAPGAQFASHAFTAKYTKADDNPRRAKDMPVHSSTASSGGDGQPVDPFGN